MDNDSALHDDDEPTAELPALTQADFEEAANTVVELEGTERSQPRKSGKRGSPKSAKRSKSQHKAPAAGDGDGDDHATLSARLKKAVQEYVEQGEALRAVARELASQSEVLEQTSKSLDRAEGTIEERDKTIAANNETIEALEARAKELEDEIATLREQIATLESSLESARSESQSETDKRTELEERFEAARADFDTQLEAARSDLSKLEADLAAERDRVSALEKNVSQLVDEANAKDAEQASLSEQLTAAQEKLAAREADLARESEEHVQTQADLESLQQRLGELGKYRDEVTTLSNYIDNRKTAWLEMENRAQEREARIKALEAELGQSAELKNKLIDYGDRIKAFEDVARQCTMDMSPPELEQEIMNLRGQIQTLGDDLERAREQLSSEQAAAADTAEQLASLQQANEKLGAELADNKEIVAEKTALAKKKSDELNQANRSLKKTEKQLKSLQTRFDKAQAELDSARESGKAAEESLSQANGRIEELEAAEKTAEQERQKTSDELRDAKRLLEEARGLVSSHEEALTRKAEQLESQTSELSDAHSVIDDQAAQLKSLNEQVAGQTDELTRLGDELAQLQLDSEDFEKTRTDLDASLSSAAEENSKLETQLEEARREAEESRAEVEAQKATLEELNESIESKSKENEELAEKIASFDSVHSELAELRDSLEEITSERDKAVAEAETLQKSLEESNAEAQRLSDEIRSRDEELEEQLSKLTHVDGIDEALPDFDKTEVYENTSEFETIDDTGEVTEGGHDDIDDEPRSVPTLICFTSDKPRQYELRKRAITIGRGAECEIQLLTHFVSREHARLYNRDGVVTIEDLGSKNGIFVNSVRVESQMLQHGDWVTVGETQFRFIRAGN